MVWAAEHSLQNGKYIIQDVLGQGGFGITYKALHTRLNRDVVIKTPNGYLKYDPDYDQYVDRFIKEGQRLAQLTDNPHPHIVRVWDLFEEGEIPCMVMDFVPGENLFQLVRRRGALPEAEIVPCIRQIGEALSVIHQAGLVHRDAHPGNIIVRPDGKAILIDFGIAKELIPSTQSSTGEAGNRGFAPYEQISKGSREPTVDVYCLAATLYFAITGERPVTSLDRRLHDAKLITPKQFKPSLSEHCNQAILKGMALEANDRPQSMRSWLALLEKPIVPPTTPTSKPPKPPATPTPSPSSPTQNRTPIRKYRTKIPKRPSRTISWGWLALSFIGYAVLGVSLTLSLVWAKAWVVSLAWVWAGVWVVAVAGVGVLANIGLLDWAVAWVVALPVAGAWVVAVVGVGVVFLTTPLTGAWAIAGAWTESRAALRLLNSFSRFHTFLILAGTSLAGLGFGWLVEVAWRYFSSQTTGMV